jgi:hypothetical protein
VVGYGGHGVSIADVMPLPSAVMSSMHRSLTYLRSIHFFVSGSPLQALISSFGS